MESRRGSSSSSLHKLGKKDSASKLTVSTEGDVEVVEDENDKVPV
jgi:hypothetical protein